MDRKPGERIFGVETEYGTLVADELLGTPEAAVELIKDYVFHEAKLGAIDLHSRDEVFEPAQSGGFLINGARLYIDAVGSHLEYATAECRSLKDLVANDRAGQRQIVRAIREMDLADQVDVYNNSIDHFGGHTFGCHENYMITASEDLFQFKVNMLYPFLVTRQIFAGVGRVGGHSIIANGIHPSYEDVAANPIDFIWVSNIYGVQPDNSVDFQLSQRADHIIKTIASRVRFNRALINPKWEHYYSHDGQTRLHLLFGEPNQNEFAYALKIGTTTLVLRMLEEDIIPETLILNRPLRALRDVSRDPDYKWMVTLLDGQTKVSAIDLQREYLRLAQRYQGEDEQTDWILREWESILDGLERNPLDLGHKIDWVAKRSIVDQYRKSEGLTWQDDALHSVDMEYHNIDPEKSLFAAYCSSSPAERIIKEIDVFEAMTEAPTSTRAHGRAKLVKEVLKTRNPRGYAFDWNSVILNRSEYYDLSDPFDAYDEVTEYRFNEKELPSDEGS